MEKMYGFKEKDVLSFIQYINENKGKSLSQIFGEYALINGKAKGTVRNLYYAIAKQSATDNEFCAKYLNGKQLSVGQIVQFDKRQERELIKKVLLAKQQGKSVRSEVMGLANSDAKLALRYQNKYRNALKNKPELIKQIVLEINKDKKAGERNLCAPEKSIVSNEQFEKLKNQIDSLVLRISSSLRKENACLKERIKLLEGENLKLMSLLYGSAKPNDTEKYFVRLNSKQFIN